MNTAPTSQMLTNGAQILDAEVGADDWIGLGLWCRAGSRFEHRGEAGWAHLLEHLWFRGGLSHDAATVDRVCDRLGGWVNAHTDRELVGIWGLAPRRAADTLTALLLDIFLTPAFTDEDVARERGLVSDELAGSLQDPGAVAVDRALACSWPGSALAEPIAGLADDLQRADAAALHDWHRDHMVGQATLATRLGKWPDREKQHINDALSSLPSGTPPSPTPPPEPAQPRYERCSSQQAILVWAAPAPGYAEPGYYASALATQALGGGLGARLPARLRRETGLVYDISARMETTLDASATVVQALTSQAQRTTAIVEDLLASLTKDGLPPSTLADALEGCHAREALRTARPVAVMRELAMQGFARRCPAHEELGDAARWALSHGHWSRICQPAAF